MYVDKEKREELFDTIEPGYYVYAKKSKWFGDGKEHMIRPFYIVGRDDEYLYGLYCTTQKKSYRKDVVTRKIKRLEDTFDNPKEYYKKVEYIVCDEIFKISREDFNNIYYISTLEFGGKVISKLSLNIVDTDKIDYNYFNLNYDIGNICIYNDNFYIIKNKIKKAKDFVLVPFSLDKVSDKYIRLNNQKYYLDNKNKIVIPSYVQNKLIIIGNKDEFKVDEKYNYGDILSVKNSNSKIVFITCLKDNVYYCLYGNDMFLGINKINKNMINEKISVLKEEEQKKLLTKINTYISKNEKNLDRKFINKMGRNK